MKNGSSSEGKYLCNCLNWELFSWNTILRERMSDRQNMVTLNQTKLAFAHPWAAKSIYWHHVVESTAFIARHPMQSQARRISSSCSKDWNSLMAFKGRFLKARWGRGSNKTQATRGGGESVPRKAPHSATPFQSFIFRYLADFLKMN